MFKWKMWGYLNHKSEIVIDFQFGDAKSFENGFVKIFELKPEYISEEGNRIEVDNFNQYIANSSHIEYPIQIH